MPNARMLSEAVTPHIIKAFGNRWYMVTADTVDGKSALLAMTETLKTNGGEVVGVVTTPFGTTDFTAALTEAKGTKPSAIVLNLYGWDLVNALKAYTKLELAKEKIGVGGMIGGEQIGRPLGYANNAGIWGLIWDPKIATESSKRFIQAVVDKYNHTPTSRCYLGYAAMTQILEAVGRAGTTETRAVIKALEGAEFDGVDGCRLAAFSRRQCAAGEAFARECGVPFLPKWQDVLRHHDVAAAIVVTPPGLNIDICVEAAKAGRAILVEKPLALTVSDARRIVNAAHDARVPIMTAQTLRFTPVLQRLKQALANAGPLHYLSIMMRVEPAAHPWLADPIQSGGGVMLEIGVHLLDMIRFLPNEEPVQVSAELVRRRTVRV